MSCEESDRRQPRAEAAEGSNTASPWPWTPDPGLWDNNPEKCPVCGPVPQQLDLTSEPKSLCIPHTVSSSALFLSHSFALILPFFCPDSFITCLSKEFPSPSSQKDVEPWEGERRGGRLAPTPPFWQEADPVCRSSPSLRGLMLWKHVTLIRCASLLLGDSNQVTRFYSNAVSHTLKKKKKKVNT